MTVQINLCRACSETTLLVFPRGGSYVLTLCLVLAMKRSSDDGEEEGIEEPDGKRLRLEIAEGEDGQQIIQQVEEIQVCTCDYLSI